MTAQIKRDRVDPIEQGKCEKEALTLELQEAVSAKEASELEKEKLAVEMQKLKEENITLKEEVSYTLQSLVNRLNSSPLSLDMTRHNQGCVKFQETNQTVSLHI